MIDSRTGNMRKGLIDMIKYIDTNMKTSMLSILEIGTYKGDSATIFAQHFKKVVCVDAWEKATFNVPGDVREAEKEFDAVVSMTSNIRKVKGMSLNIAKLWTVPVDVVYIDASHDYENVKADLLAWSNKATLFVCGHDYWPSKFPGVVRAVNEVLGKPDKVFADTSFLVKL